MSDRAPVASTLHLEYVQSADALSSAIHPAGSLVLVETRTMLQDNRRATSMWLFAMVDPAEGSSPAPQVESTLKALAHNFRGAPKDEPVGVSLNRFMQGATDVLPANQSLVVCALCFDRAVVAHTGNACCYLVRHNHATRLTLRNVQLIDYQIQPGDVLLLSGEPLQSVKGSEMAELAGHGVDLSAAANKVALLLRQRHEPLPVGVVMIRVLGVQRSGPKSHPLRTRAKAG